ncbi:hypothetical protein Bca4012_099538 [Brassica carinata]|uniref:BnaC06g15070D protein n=2 Tax=Brassica napus TaxID=3708 RepID=A0A078F3D3_BRANA|nr:uncharacterized protein LOC106409289 [Brassica napus]KAH0873812.1 hypothetical protein HID58_071174 [Brassica napus]CAF2058593.1 unnamed protein product [Brassica napus]CDY07557.1 BnaC06g15070D [Brassica napus]
MAKSSRSKGSSNIGNGVITPTQIAFIVDRYLHDNRFSKTRSLFRSEASSLLSNSPVRDVLKSYLTLEDILKDYVSLREQKVALDHEKVILEKEKVRVQNLLQGMQNVMNTYNATLISPPPLPVAAPASQQKSHTISSGCTQDNTQNANDVSVSLLGNKRVRCGNFYTPSTTHHQLITRKRKGHETSVEAPSVARKARIGNSTANESSRITQAEETANDFSSQTPSETLTLAKNSSANKPMTGDVSSVADSSLTSNSTCLMTPQKHASSVSGKSNSPQKEVTPTNCTIVTKERFTISPLKQITSYTMERSHLISSSSPVKSNLKMSNKRDHVKGRLNFDDTDTDMCLEAAPTTADLASSSPSGSEQEVDLSDIDFSILAEDFSFSELLVDFDIGFEGSTHRTPIGTVSWSSPESGNGDL